MQETKKLELNKLLGFATIDQLAGVDFRGDTFGAKLGAKVGDLEAFGPRTISFTKLLGFEILGERMSDGVDFRDETVADKLGAKVGIEIESPAE